jgi:hypothetical protein
MKPFWIDTCIYFSFIFVSFNYDFNISDYLQNNRIIGRLLTHALKRMRMEVVMAYFNIHLCRVPEEIDEMPCAEYPAFIPINELVACRIQSRNCYNYITTFSDIGVH